MKGCVPHMLRCGDMQQRRFTCTAWIGHKSCCSADQSSHAMGGSWDDKQNTADSAVSSCRQAIQRKTALHGDGRNVVGDTYWLLSAFSSSSQFTFRWLVSFTALYISANSAKQKEACYRQTPWHVAITPRCALHLCWALGASVVAYLQGHCIAVRLSKHR